MDALFLAPDGVIRDGFPLADNEPVIGLDLLNHPVRSPDARLALETGRLTLPSPYQLVQGQIGIIGRLPVFLDDAQGNPAFWGFAIARMPFPDAIAPSHLSQLDERGIAYRLWTITASTGEHRIIDASPVEPIAPVEAQLQVPNATWTLSLSPVDGWGDPLGLSVRSGLGLLFSLLLAMLAKLLADARAQEAWLAMQVAERTAEVRAREADLKHAEERSSTPQARHLDDRHRVYKTLFALRQGGKGLEGFADLDDRYLISLDGTGYFSSQTIHCTQCAEKHHRNGITTYYHQMLGAVLVHPDCAEVFPLAPEPILKPDGAKKNDCERNAAKRLLTDLRREHPHLKLIVVEDALASNGPHIRHLQALDLRLILGATPSDHTFLFDWVAAGERTAEASFSEENGFRHRASVTSTACR